jgi:Helitron helicase-like domain at N-terminus
MLILLAIGTPQVNNLLSIWAFYRYHAYTRNLSFNVLHLSCLATKIWQPPVDALCFPLRSPEVCAICNTPISTPWPLYGPDYFITFTANPNWEEIQAELLTDDQGDKMQSTRDRPDLVARVFKMIRDLKSNKVLGEYVAHVSVIKRALPHPPLGQNPIRLSELMT